MTGIDLADRIGRASRWIEASGIPVHPAEQVRAWFDGLGVAPPVGIQQLMTAIRVGVIAAGDAGYAAGRAQADDLADRLADALTDAAGLGDARQVPHEDRVIRWRALLAEHAARAERQG